jgi:hypothetical protein
VRRALFVHGGHELDFVGAVDECVEESGVAMSGDREHLLNALADQDVDHHLAAGELFRCHDTAFVGRR